MGKIRAQLAAKKIVTEACITEPNELSLEEINFFLNGPEIVTEDLRGYEGKFMSLDDVSVIKIDNKIKNEGRKRFTLAHELGHFVLHRDKNYIACTPADFNDWSGRKEIETEANYFASEILMPSEIFNKASKKEKFTVTFLNHLANEFKTSLTATAIKFVEEGHDPIFCICSRKGKVIWKMASPQFNFKIDFKNIHEVPQTSVTFEIMNLNRQYADAQEIDPAIWHIYAEENELKFYENTIVIDYYDYTLSFISIR